MLPLSVATVVFACALGFALFRLTSGGALFNHHVGVTSWFMDDFHVAVYYPVRAFLDGGNPYHSSSYVTKYPVSPFPVYAPATLLLYLPFGMLPLAPAGAVYFVVTIILTIVLAIAALRLAGWVATPANVIGLSGLILLSRPGHWNLLLGQVTLPSVLGVYATLRYARAAPMLAGMGLAVSLLKPTFGVPLAVILLGVGWWRPIFHGAWIAALLNLPIVAILITRAGGVKLFLAQIAESQARFGEIGPADPVRAVGRIDLVALLSRLQGFPLEAPVAVLVSVSVLGLTVLGLRRLGPPRNFTTAWIAGGLICSAVLLSTFHHAYDLLLMVLPATGLVRLVQMKQPFRFARLSQALLFGILAINYVTTEWFIAAVQPGQFARLVLSSINGLALLGLFGLYFVDTLNAARIVAALPSPSPDTTTRNVAASPESYRGYHAAG